MRFIVAYRCSVESDSFAGADCSVEDIGQASNLCITKSNDGEILVGLWNLSPFSNGGFCCYHSKLHQFSVQSKTFG